MFNLLPEKTKNEVRLEFRRRTWGVFLFIAFLVFVISSTLSLPYFLNLHAMRFELEKELSNFRQSSILVDYQQLADELEKTNKELLATKNNISNHLNLQSLLEAVGSARPSTVKINRFAFNRKDDSASLILSGESANREALKDFTAKLKGISQFNVVDVPLSSFTKATEADFSVTLEIALKAKKDE